MAAVQLVEKCTCVLCAMSWLVASGVVLEHNGVREMQPRAALWGNPCVKCKFKMERASRMRTGRVAQVPGIAHAE